MVIQPGAQQDRPGGGGQWPQFDRPPEHPREEAAEKGKSSDSDGQRKQAQTSGQDNAASLAGRHPPQFQVEMHGPDRASGFGFRRWPSGSPTMALNLHHQAHQ